MGSVEIFDKVLASVTTDFMRNYAKTDNLKRFLLSQVISETGVVVQTLATGQWTFETNLINVNKINKILDNYAVCIGCAFEAATPEKTTPETTKQKEFTSTATLSSLSAEPYHYETPPASSTDTLSVPVNITQLVPSSSFVEEIEKNVVEPCFSQSSSEDNIEGSLILTAENIEEPLCITPEAGEEIMIKTETDSDNDSVGFPTVDDDDGNDFSDSNNANIPAQLTIQSGYENLPPGGDIVCVKVQDEHETVPLDGDIVCVKVQDEHETVPLGCDIVCVKVQDEHETVPLGCDIVCVKVQDEHETVPLGGDTVCVNVQGADETLSEQDDTIVVKPRGRGRPRTGSGKANPQAQFKVQGGHDTSQGGSDTLHVKPRTRGRPRKGTTHNSDNTDLQGGQHKGRGRPRKATSQPQQQTQGSRYVPYFELSSCHSNAPINILLRVDKRGVAILTGLACPSDKIKRRWIFDLKTFFLTKHHYSELGI